MIQTPPKYTLDETLAQLSKPAQFRVARIAELIGSIEAASEDDEYDIDPITMARELGFKVAPSELKLGLRVHRRNVIRATREPAKRSAQAVVSLNAHRIAARYR